MKMAILLLAVLFGIWLWKRSRVRHTKPPSQKPVKPNSEPNTMVSCLHCRIHFPQDEGALGVLGLYCSQAHRHAAGDRSPAP
jgi:uncharacterized protein